MVKFAKSSLVFIGIFMVIASACPNENNQIEGTILIKNESLIKNKALIEQNDVNLLKAKEMLVQRANEILGNEPYSVTFKEEIPETATRHDYVSLAPYMWPDPSKKDGLPFIQRDGERNPLISSYRDSYMLGNLGKEVEVLGLAYYYTGNEVYAERAAYLLKVFFMDPDTKMNPNFNHSQMVMGKDSSGGNIIEANVLMKVVDGIQLIKNSEHWTAKDQKEMQQWFASFLDWMINSKKGKIEARRQNNIATFYTLQAAVYALFINNKALATKIIESRGYKNVEEQIAKDGSMPMELKRANPWNYVVYNLGAFYNLMLVSEHVDIDLWDFKTEESGSIKQTYHWVESFAEPEKNTFNFHGHYVGMVNMKRFLSNNPQPDSRIGQRDLTEIRSRLGEKSEVDRNNYIEILTK